jgi:hypothetical protein
VKAFAIVEGIEVIEDDGGGAGFGGKGEPSSSNLLLREAKALSAKALS